MIPLLFAPALWTTFWEISTLPVTFSASMAAPVSVVTSKPETVLSLLTVIVPVTFGITPLPDKGSVTSTGPGRKSTCDGPLVSTRMPAGTVNPATVPVDAART